MTLHRPDVSVGRGITSWKRLLGCFVNGSVSNPLDIRVVSTRVIGFGPAAVFPPVLVERSHGSFLPPECLFEQLIYRSDRIRPLCLHGFALFTYQRTQIGKRVLYILGEFEPGFTILHNAVKWQDACQSYEKHNVGRNTLSCPAEVEYDYPKRAVSGDSAARYNSPRVMEGVRRLRTIAHVLMLYGTLAGIAIWFLCTFLLRSLGIFELLFLAGAPAMSGGVLNLFAWVVEGFLTTDRPAR